ncbi:MAG: DUF5106 domain-containing protein [Muribaculaceae bacterium]|nr:DUF5106 domain-containing protein [Muribaculaceae bacterium]
MKKYISIIFTIFLLSIVPIQAQQRVLQIEPLFEYPVAPDELHSIQEKCDYLVKNFWNNFDFKTKNAIDQYALNEAFEVYLTTFQFASAKEVDQSFDKLIKNLSSNPLLLMQFGKAAEENLYGPRANFWSDQLYLKLLDAIIKNKKIAEKRKAKYISQAATIRNTEIGKTAPEFWFQDKERASKQYFPMSTPTLLIFGDPDDTDWRLARLKMESNFKLSEALEKGKINILYILPMDKENWANEVSNYNKYWTLGQSNDVKNIYDIRVYPAIYIVGSDGKIAKKNLSIEDSVTAILELVN